MPHIDPDTFDLIVLGTGLQESITAAAASLAGLSVLHLDPQPEYGSHWAGLTLERFLEWSREQSAYKSSTLPVSEATRAGDAGTGPLIELRIPNGRTLVYGDVLIEDASKTDLGSSGQYILDLAPKVLFTSGAMVDALLRCRAISYLVFRLVHSCLWQDGRAMSVPSSRADIFKSRTLSPGDKRALMRFLKSTMEALAGEGPLKSSLPGQIHTGKLQAEPHIALIEHRASWSEAFNEGSFADLLQAEGLPQPLQKVILYSLAQLDSSQEEGGEAAVSGRCTAAEALQRLGVYFDSVSKFGGAFMIPDYGPGELPQAFCRTAAVHGAIYVLRCGIAAVLIDAESRLVRAIRTLDGQVLHCRGCAANPDLLPPEFTSRSQTTEISRAVAVLESPLKCVSESAAASKSSQMLLTIPPGALSPGVPRNPIRVLQLGQQSFMAPNDRCILHLSCIGNGRSDLQAAIASLLGSEGGSPKAAFTAYYTQRTGFSAADGVMPDNIALCQPPNESAGYQEAIASAEQGFHRLFPNKRFLLELPKGTDPYDSD